MWRTSRFRGGPIRDWLWSGALALPGLAFYLHSSRVGLSAGKIVFHGWDDKLDSLGMILHGYWPWLDWISLAALAVWFLAAWWRNPEFRWDRKWIAIAAFLFALFWVIPWMWGEGSDLDIRVLPFLFVAILATARVGRRAKMLVAIPLLLFAARTVSVTRHFREVQPALAGLARSFDAVPRGALVLPIVEGDEDPIERPFTHFWAYGVIRRGWFSPYLMDAPGETPMRIIHESYTPDGFWNLVYEEPPDWQQVQNDYDYVWAYDVPRFSASARGNRRANLFLRPARGLSHPEISAMSSGSLPAQLEPPQDTASSLWRRRTAIVRAASESAGRGAHASICNKNRVVRCNLILVLCC